MVKCSKCGKDLRLGIDAYCHGELILCKDCNEKIGKAEQEKIEIEEDITKTLYLKQNLVKTEMSLPDLQLQEIRQIKNDVSTIKNIMLFFLILFIIMFAIFILIAFYTLPI